MTKLEQKLIELGYELTSIKYKRNKPSMPIYQKKLNNTCHIEVHYIFYNKDWFIHLYVDRSGIMCEYELENINDTFNEMQKDLEELKQYEEIYNKTN